MTKQPTASKDLYLDGDGKVVPAGLDAAFLLVRAGKPVPVGYEEPAAPKPKAPPKVKAKPKARRKAATKEVKAGGDK